MVGDNFDRVWRPFNVTPPQHAGVDHRKQFLLSNSIVALSRLEASALISNWSVILEKHSSDTGAACIGTDLKRLVDDKASYTGRETDWFVNAIFSFLPIFLIPAGIAFYLMRRGG